MHEWEQVQSDDKTATFRMVVPGGWLYLVGPQGMGRDHLTFVPDPNQWARALLAVETEGIENLQ